MSRGKRSINLFHKVKSSTVSQLCPNWIYSATGLALRYTQPDSSVLGFSYSGTNPLFKVVVAIDATW
jgi:hypothetical protein